MMLRVTEDFVYNGKNFYEGQIIKMGTADYNQVKDKVEMADRFTKEVLRKDTKEVTIRKRGRPAKVLTK